MVTPRYARWLLPESQKNLELHAGTRDSLSRFFSHCRLLHNYNNTWFHIHLKIKLMEGEVDYELMHLLSPTHHLSQLLFVRTSRQCHAKQARVCFCILSNFLKLGGAATPPSQAYIYASCLFHLVTRCGSKKESAWVEAFTGSQTLEQNNRNCMHRTEASCKRKPWAA